MRGASGADPADKDFSLVHGDVRVSDQRGQVVGETADSFPGVAPLERDTDLMDRLAVYLHRLDAFCHQSAGFDLAARRCGDHPAAVLDAVFRREFRAEFDEHGGHQFIQPRIEP